MLQRVAVLCALAGGGCAPEETEPQDTGAAGGGASGSAGAGGGGASGSAGAAGGSLGTGGAAGTPIGGAGGTTGAAGTGGATGFAGTGGATGAGGTGGAIGVAGAGGRGGASGAAGTAAAGAGGRGGGAGGSAGGAGGSAGTTGGGGRGGGAGGSAGTGSPATFKVFDQIPQFGMYATSNPRNYTPPAGVLMWSYGAYFVAKLSAEQRAAIGADLAARITYHAQCDDYDRLATVFFVLAPAGQMPRTNDPRTELVRFITPFSDYMQGARATRVFPNADISAYAAMLATSPQDVWIGIGGGSNPYDGDPCTNANVTPEFSAIGYKFSLELVSTQPLASGAGTIITALNYVQATSVPVAGTLNNPGGDIAGRVTVIVSGHGSAAGGVEYANTQDTLSVGGTQIGSFSTKIDCASYEQYSPRGNPGIFRNNNSSNPRNWCPGALVPSHTFPVTLRSGSQSVSLGVSPTQVPSGSYYATSISFTSP